MNTYNITENELNQIIELFSSQPLRSFSKNEIILEPNSIFKNIYLIERGVIRTFYYSSNGDDISHWFSFENNLIAMLSSALDQSISAYGLQALEDTAVRIITFESLVKLKESSPEITLLIEKVIISSFIKVSNRLVDIQTKTAKERYEKLLTEQPDIFKRVNLSHIATYLGMKRQSLSRIRASK